VAPYIEVLHKNSRGCARDGGQQTLVSDSHIFVSVYDGQACDEGGIDGE
jgi:hypothetical protein